MKLVKESISFKRGIGSKSSLDLGTYYMDNPSYEDWLRSPSGFYLIKSEYDTYNVIFYDSKERLFNFIKGFAIWSEELENVIYIRGNEFGLSIKADKITLTQKMKEKSGKYFKKPNNRFSILWALKLRDVPTDIDLEIAKRKDREYVSESLSFERGVSSKSSLDIGRSRSENLKEYTIESLSDLIEKMDIENSEFTNKKRQYPYPSVWFDTYHDIHDLRISVALNLSDGNREFNNKLKGKILDWITKNLKGYRIDKTSKPMYMDRFNIYLIKK